jgi:hypothetical protein
MSYRTDALVARLFDLLAAAAPGKVQRDDLMSSLGITEVAEFHDIKGRLQDVLGADATQAVVGESAGEGGWYYGLEGSPADAVARAYLIYKTKRERSFLRRHRNVMVALARSAGGGTAARMVRRHIRDADRMIEDLTELLDELV